MDVWLSTIGQRLDHAENTRTMLLARYLRQGGHRVTLWTSAFDHIRKEWRSEWTDAGGGAFVMADGLTVRFMKGCGYYRNIGPRRLLDHWLAARNFRRQAEALPKPDIVVASLPDHVTAAAMVQFARERNCAAIVDVRDKWPDVFFDAAPEALRPAAKAAFAWESRRVRRALQRADARVAMMQSMLDWGHAKARREASPSDKVFFLSTMDAVTPADAPLSDLPEALRKQVAGIEGRLTFTYVGTFNRTQHPLLAIEAFEQLSRRPGFDPSRIALLVGGDGLDASEVERRVNALPFGRFLGWLKPPEMRAVLVRSHVGLLPLNFASPAFNNKAFAYLAAGLPILNCALGDLADLIEIRDLGINIEAGDASALADAVSTLIHQPDRVAAMSANVRTAYGDLFDQERTYRDYVAHIEHVAAMRGQVAG